MCANSKKKGIMRAFSTPQRLSDVTNRMLLVITIVTALNACQSQTQLNQYPFYEPHRLTEAEQFSSWWQTLNKHQEQSEALSRCKTNPTGCPGKLKSYGHVIREAKNLTRTEQLELVHHYINGTKYDEDKVVHHYDHENKKKQVTRSSWKTLYDFLLNGGDCEDYATSKYFMLRELGFQNSDMRIVVTYSTKLFGYHAVVAVRQPDNSIWLLDSEYPIKKNSHMGYRYVYAMNEQAVWDHRDDFISPSKQQSGNIRHENTNIERPTSGN